LIGEGAPKRLVGAFSGARVAPLATGKKLYYNYPPETTPAGKQKKISIGTADFVDILYYCRRCSGEMVMMDGRGPRRDYSPAESGKCFI
jgi:hypothetical protein